MDCASESVDMTPEEAGKRASELAKGCVESSMATRLSHAGVVPMDNAPMFPPIQMATTYLRPADGQYKEQDSIYSRHDNPTRLLLEKEIAALECSGNGAAVEATCCAFSSGMMAVSSIILAHTSPLHVLLPLDTYHGVPTVLMDVFRRFNVTMEKVLMTDPEALRYGLSNVPPHVKDVIVWMETPSNPQCHVIDIEGICAIVTEYSKGSSAKAVTTVVDSTLAPPTLTRPLQLGADLVLHSGTKYLGGHSDVLLGIVTASPWTTRGQELGPALHTVQASVGGVASPMDSWLTLRGLRTLHVRVERQCQTALKIAKFLDGLVQKVHYPGLPSHPHHATALKQMPYGFGGVLSIEMETEAQAMALAGALQTVLRATSLGGTETLIEHRYSIEPQGRKVSPPGLLRISTGLEDEADLIADFSRALNIVEKVCPKPT